MSFMDQIPTYSKHELKKALEVKLTKEFKDKYKEGYEEVLKKELAIQYQRKLEDARAGFFMDGIVLHDGDEDEKYDPVSNMLSIICAELFWIQANASIAFEVVALLHTRMACRLPALAANEVGADDYDDLPKRKRPMPMPKANADNAAAPGVIKE